ncbi:hypothetical protein L6R52_32780 [Myxococcota bacterium]|nr:hypothetical protein [Myxococcota bacterium]
MTTWIHHYLGGAMLALVLGAPVAASAAPPKILVQDLVAQGVEAHEAAVLSTAACQAFAKSPKHEVLCGEDVRNLMKLSAMSASFDGGCTDEKCYSALGKAMKARFVVSGTVSKLGATYILSLSMFDTEQGKAAGRTELKGASLEKLHADVPEAVSTILGPTK